MSKIVTADEAAKAIKDGATVGVALMGLAGWPEEVARAIERRFLETGHPRDLTLVYAAGQGDGSSDTGRGAPMGVVAWPRCTAFMSSALGARPATQ